MRLTTAASALVLAFCLHGAARAAEPEHSGLSFLLNAGGYSGIGAGLGFGTGEFGVKGFGGWAPVLIVLKETSSSSNELKFYSGLMGGGDAYFRLLKPQPTSDVGVQAGYRYSSVLGHGLAFGGYGQFAVSRSVDFNVSIGFLVFPDGEDRLKRDQNLPTSTEFSFPGPKVNFTASVGLAFFP